MDDYSNFKYERMPGVHDMKSQAKMIGERLREIRTIMEISTATMAQVTGVSEAEYIAHEAGEIDSSFTFISAWI